MGVRMMTLVSVILLITLKLFIFLGIEVTFEIFNFKFTTIYNFTFKWFLHVVGLLKGEL